MYFAQDLGSAPDLTSGQFLVRSVGQFNWFEKGQLTWPDQKIGWSVADPSSRHQQSWSTIHDDWTFYRHIAVYCNVRPLVRDRAIPIWTPSARHFFVSHHVPWIIRQTQNKDNWILFFCRDTLRDCSSYAAIWPSTSFHNAGTEGSENCQWLLDGSNVDPLLPIMLTGTVDASYGITKKYRTATSGPICLNLLVFF